MLVDRFGEHPRPEDVRGVVIDRACDVHPLCLRLAREGNEVCARYAELPWAVDPFHVKGHKVGLVRFKINKLTS